MGECVSCGLSLVTPRLFSCDHCRRPYCIVCLKKHADDITMTFRTIPKLAKERR